MQFKFKVWLKENKNSLIFLTLLVLLVYANAWGAEFVSDDVYGIVNNPRLGDFKQVLVNRWQFLRPLYYFVAVNLFGKVPWAFRLLNIGSHLLMAVAVYALVKLMVNQTVGLMAGVLTAVHPIMVESVTWISGGAYSQYSLLVVVSMILYILAGKDRRYYWWSVASFLAALLFSEKAAMLPGILLIYQLMFARKQRQWQELIPFFVLSGIWAGLYLGQAGERLTDLQTGFSGGGQKLNPLVQIPVAITSYLGLIFWPDKLALYHSEMIFSPLNYGVRAGVTGALLLLIGWAGWQGWQGKNWGKQTAFWLSWLIISLLPTLTPLGVSWIVAERYVYLGAVGIFVLLAWGGWRLSQRKGWQEPMAIVFVLLTLALMIRTVVRNHDWKNQDNLWLAGARTSPSSSQNNNNLGDLYGRRGDLKRAEWHFKRAIELNPVYAEAHHNLANTYWQMGELEKAIEYYQKALQLRPNLWQSHLQLANIYYQQGKKDEMRQELEAVLKIVPNHEGVRKALEEL